MIFWIYYLLSQLHMNNTTSNSKYVDISGIDKDTLLEALWENSEPATLFRMPGMKSPLFDLNEAKASLDDGYADYICGRVIKTDIYSTYVVDPRMYDTYLGEGAFTRVVQSLRK